MRQLAGYQSASMNLQRFVKHIAGNFCIRQHLKKLGTMDGSDNFAINMHMGSPDLALNPCCLGNDEHALLPRFTDDVAFDQAIDTQATLEQQIPSNIHP